MSSYLSTQFHLLYNLQHMCSWSSQVPGNCSLHYCDTHGFHQYKDWSLGTERNPVKDNRQKCVEIFHNMDASRKEYTQWDIHNNAIRTSQASPCFALDVPLHNLQHGWFCAMWPDHANGLYSWWNQNCVVSENIHTPLPPNRRLLGLNHWASRNYSFASQLSLKILTF